MVPAPDAAQGAVRTPASLRAIVVMGVSGAGKSTVGAALAARLGWEYVDGDEAHPAANLDKMRRGIPLEDADRWPWLRSLHRTLTERLARGARVVVACSALTSAYRAALVGDEVGVVFVYLRGQPDLLAARLATRPSHFMAPSLLQSQLDLLEPPADGVVVDVDQPVAGAVDAVVAALALGDPKDAKGGP
jgi:carbohydrate kinase (thermoresistant glucokinase family)